MPPADVNSFDMGLTDHQPRTLQANPWWKLCFAPVQASLRSLHLEGMRRLLILRHAKSDYPDGTPDHERPLARRGREAAPRMAAYMAAEGLLPDAALVSTALRTRSAFSAGSGRRRRTCGT